MVKHKGQFVISSGKAHHPKLEAEFPPLPPKGFTYAIDGATGERVPVPPAGKCGATCRDCWPD